MLALKVQWKFSRSHSEFFFGKSSQNSSKPVLIFWSSVPYVFCLYLLKVVSYYDFSVLPMSVIMGFQKKFGWGWVDGVSSIQVYFGFFEFFKNLQSPLVEVETFVKSAIYFGGLMVRVRVVVKVLVSSVVRVYVMVSVNHPLHDLHFAGLE